VRLAAPMTLRLQIKDLGGLMNQLATERYAQELSIRYVSGPATTYQRSSPDTWVSLFGLMFSVAAVVVA
jgi:hypothetical protein